ncbi:hypothetical protein VaNZ11_009193 [Volvox africanus]|uniref:Smr domain-containing protein n=1 Tax=Volvox africanus TaxID=51714 RepID=A0ABQ5S874_9CHLO|nr:hypothetical protein VaNZ11_009193 [Volvox africanus]
MDLSVLAALQEMFPSMPDEVLHAALDAHNGLLEDAISTLLELCSGNPDGEAFRPSALTSNNTTGVLGDEEKQFGSSSLFPGETKELLSGKPNTRGLDQRHCRRGRGSGGAPAARTTWAQLRTEEHQSPIQLHQHRQPLGPQQNPKAAASQPHPQTILIPPPSASLNPKYVAPGGVSATAAHLADTDFPDLLNHPSGTKATKPNVGWHCSRGASLRSRALTSAPLSKSIMSYSANDLQDLGTRTGRLSFTSSACFERHESASGGGAAETDRQSSGGYAAAARCARRRPWPSASAWQTDDMYGNGGAAAATGMGTEESWEQEALDELCRSHPWAGRELVEGVCLALKYNLAEVVEALDELNAASYQYGRSGSSSPTASCSDDEEADENPELSNTAAAVEPYDVNAAPRCRPDKRSVGRGGSSATASAAATVASGGGGHSCGEAMARGGDVYIRHRQSALKLTHAWRKLMKKASAAFTVGDRVLGRRLVSEAQDLRRQAAEAHGEAAKRIVLEMNEGRQLSEWELDLHGLHAAEAVEALARRIKALEEGSALAAAAVAAAAAPVATAGAELSGGGGGGGGGSTKRRMQQQRRTVGSDGSAVAAAAAAAATAEHKAPADVAAAAATAKLLASGRVLRVIVGKGLHSGGGEASLPRVVKNFLLDRGYRFIPRPGVIEVQLRRRFAVNSPSVIAAAGTATAAAAVMGK